jgi:lipid-A-disaccharide synthase
MSNFDIILVANSPGELSALVKPVAETLSEKVSDARIILVLTPCQYTSGKEIEYIKGIKGIEEIISADGYKKWVLKNQRPDVDFRDQGLVLYLGGDLAHAMLVAKKVKYPAYAYVQDWIGWKGFYKKFFMPDEQSRLKLDRKNKLNGKAEVIGNLMVDSVRDIKKWTPEKNTITFLPGSRAWQINHTTPIYEKIIENIKQQNPDAIIQLVSSPFERAINIHGVSLINFEDAWNSELVITIPGTNTARLAAMGMPMLVVFPLDNLDVIPLEGLAHFVCMIPFLGSKIKKYLANTMNKHTKYFALPNIKADKEIVTEIRGVIDPEEVAQKALELMNDAGKRQEMSRELISAMGDPGAAQKIAEEINEALRQAA